MTSLKGRLLSVAAALAMLTAAAIVAAGLVAPSGCASNCGSNCPPVTIYIGNLNGQQLMIDDIGVSGPACPPPEGVYCIGDVPGTNCTHFTITGNAEGICDVTIVFHDRPTMIVRTQFGPPVQQGCCRGYSIVGDSVFVIPASPDAGISGLDGGTDAVTILVDGG
jgi:hypothetical protein